jgi:cation:H+ antiporter
MVLVHALLVVGGLVFLVKGADIFVDSVSRVARRLNVSEFVIGLTLVAIGTSIPELASSIAASTAQQSGIVIGNVIGSNVANIALILGAAAIVLGVAVKEEMVRRDGYVALFAVLLFYLFASDGVISILDAIVFLLLEFSYIVFLLETKSSLEEKHRFKEFITGFFKFTYVRKGGRKILSTIDKSRRPKEKPSTETEPEQTLCLKCDLRKELLIVILSVVAVALGAYFLVEGVVFFAYFFGVPEMLIAITLVAVGTSLPELSVTLSAAKKHYGEIAVGNIIGSCISNIFLILGVSAVIYPLTISTSTLLFATPFLVLTTILLILFMKSQWHITQTEGVALLIVYGAFMVISLIVL